MITLRLIFVAIALLALPNHAAAHCRLALLLSFDVSSSISAQDYDLQRNGIAAALMSPDVTQAILGGGYGNVAIAAYEWSGRRQQKTVLGWVMLRTKEDIAAAASVIASHRRSYSRYPTAMGYSFGYGAKMLETAPKCDRQVVDVAGDGINNDGFGPRRAYERFPFDGVTINGLVINGNDPDVEWFYETEVLLGAHSFLEVANGYSDFQRAMTAKLFREISDVVVGLSPVQPTNEKTSSRRPRS